MSGHDYLDPATGFSIAGLLAFAWAWVATKPWRNRRG
jgi:hypothetical protein